MAIELPDVDRSNLFRDYHPGAGYAGNLTTDRTGRQVTGSQGRPMVAIPQELPELSEARLFDRRISLVNRVKSFIDLFISWVRRTPTKGQKSYIEALHHKVSGQALTEDQVNDFYKSGKILVQINTPESFAAMLMVSYGLAELLSSQEDLLVVKFIRPENNESLEQKTSELLNQFRIDKLINQAHTFMRSYFSGVDEECHMAIAAECVEAAAEKVIESLIASPVCLESVFDKVATFNFWLSVRYMLDGKVAFQADDAPNEFDKIFDSGRGVHAVIGKDHINPFLLRVAPQILETPLSDNASQTAQRVKASAPYLMLWLADRLGMEPTRQRCSVDEAALIKQALEQL